MQSHCEQKIEEELLAHVPTSEYLLTNTTQEWYAKHCISLAKSNNMNKSSSLSNGLKLTKKKVRKKDNTCDPTQGESIESENMKKPNQNSEFLTLLSTNRRPLKCTVDWWHYAIVHMVDIRCLVFVICASSFSFRSYLNEQVTVNCGGVFKSCTACCCCCSFWTLLRQNVLSHRCLQQTNQ